MKVLQNFPFILALIAANLLTFSAYAFTAPPDNLELVSEGTYLSLYTSGKMIKQKRNPKSSIWNVPSRKLKEMWVQKAGETEMIRLDPKRFRKQLLQLLSEFPEVHRTILYKGFTYKELPKYVKELNEHVAKVKTVRIKRIDIRLNSRGI